MGSERRSIFFYRAYKTMQNQSHYVHVYKKLVITMLYSFAVDSIRFHFISFHVSYSILFYLLYSIHFYSGLSPLFFSPFPSSPLPSPPLPSPCQSHVVTFSESVLHGMAFFFVIRVSSERLRKIGRVNFSC